MTNDVPKPCPGAIWRRFAPTLKGEITIPSANTTKHYFEFVGGTSDTSWEICTNGDEVLVRFGRHGTNGQFSTKTFADNAAAKKYAKKRIREKVGKGCVEVE